MNPKHFVKLGAAMRFVRPHHALTVTNTSIVSNTDGKVASQPRGFK